MRDSISALNRARLLEAMADAAAEEGFAKVTVSGLCERAGVSRRTFYLEFDSREKCFLGLMEEGLRQASRLIIDAFPEAETWQQGIRDALAALLAFFESRPTLTRALFVESLAAGSWALEYRERSLGTLTESILGHWNPPPRAGNHPLAAMTVMAAILAVIQRHLISDKREPLISLLGPLMGIVAAPYMRPDEVEAEMGRADSYARELRDGVRTPRFITRVPRVEVPALLLDPRSKRARAALRYLAAHPGSSNRQVGAGVGVASHTQMSRLLARLMDLGLLTKTCASPGGANAWSLSACGEEILASISRAESEALPTNIRAHIYTPP